MGNSQRARVFITGRVQGVCYRLETQREALRIGITGWVKNNPDFSVEAVFEGDEEKVRKIIEWCHTGPSYSKVKNVEIRKEEFTGKYKKFKIRY